MNTEYLQNKVESYTQKIKDDTIAMRKLYKYLIQNVDTDSGSPEYEDECLMKLGIMCQQISDRYINIGMTKAIIGSYKKDINRQKIFNDITHGDVGLFAHMTSRDDDNS